MTQVETDYYETSDLWRPERFDAGDEQERFAECAELVPADAMSLLDVGCGQGAFLRHLEARRSDLNLRGLERSKSAISQAVCSSPIDLGSIDRLPFGDGAFDVASVLEVLEHLPHGVYERGLQELSRVAGQAIIVSVPFAEKRHQVRCPHCGCRFHPNYHMRSFEPRTFGSLFEGFRLETRKVLNFRDYAGGPLLRWGYRLLNGGADVMRGSVCPQCGYHEESPPETARERARSRIRHRLPQRERPHWLIGRFTRTT